jgi:hypothetical protein
LIPRAAIILFLFFVFIPALSFALPPLSEKIEEATGLPLTINQKEKLAEYSNNKHVVLKDAQDILVKQLSSILSLPEESIRHELFSEIGTPHAILDPITGAQIEKLLGREMTKTEYELVDMAFRSFKEKEKVVYAGYSGQVANLVDLPQDTVQDLVSR